MWIGLGLSGFAHASYFYTEAAPTLSEFRGGSPFFGSGLDSPTSIGLGYSFGFFFSLDNAPIQLQIGVVNRMDNSSDQGNSLTLLTVYPELRLQITRLFVGAGVTNVVFSRDETISGIDNLGRSASSLAYLVEAGVLFPITPKFSFGGSGTLEYVKTGGNLSPSPAVSANILLRFYFGFSHGGGSSNEFKGWRYPFGNELH